MTYKVSFSSGNNYSVRYKDLNAYKASFYRSITPMKLKELSDVQISGNNDQYVLMYDANLDKWKDVNPDVVLNSAAANETTQPGLVGFATAFLDRVGIDLDDRIDLDAGQF
jgi:hypothetical protein